MKMNHLKAPKKQTQFKPNFPPIQLISVTRYVNIGNYKEGFEKRNIVNPIFLQVVYELGMFQFFLNKAFYS